MCVQGGGALEELKHAVKSLIATLYEDVYTWRGGNREIDRERERERERDCIKKY